MKRRIPSPYRLRQAAGWVLPKALYWFFPLTAVYLELIHRAAFVRPFWSGGLLYTLLLSVTAGCLCTLLASLFRRTARTVVSGVLLGLLLLICGGQTLYYTIFQTYFTLYSVTGAADASQFWRDALAGLWSSAVPLLLMLLPLVWWIRWGRRLLAAKRMDIHRRFTVALAVLVGLSGAQVLIDVNHTGSPSPAKLYNEVFVPTLSVPQFGILATLRLDAWNLMGLMQEQVAAPVESGDPSSAESSAPADDDSSVSGEDKPPVYRDNIMTIDFDSLIAADTDATLKTMDQYFASLTPTKQNQYTGLWKGKNLIWICAEGFSSYALDKTLTPTLYALAHQGFVFENFYNPIWGVSTSDGEYVTMTSLVPKSGVWSFYRSSSIAMPFGMANLLKPQGYTTKAYHDHTYTYYDRHLSHPNLGYDYQGVGNGLKIKKTWPSSDVEMMQVTVPEYVNKTPFHTYYMTVSGHLRYSFGGNYIAAKNRELVPESYGSEPVRAYMACQIELDRAVKYLLDSLQQAGQLANTAIVLSGDHYPYGLEMDGLDALDEIAGHTLERNFEMYQSTLILWAGDMTAPIPVTRPASSLDILPTLCNLMGITYDSRLLMGQDLLSDAPPLVVFSNRSWLTDQGRYDSRDGSFTPFDTASGTDWSGYQRRINQRVSAMFTYSAKILETNYYRHVMQGLKTTS